MLTFTANVQFVPQPSLAHEVCPLTVSLTRSGVPSATITLVISNTQLFPESRAGPGRG